MVFSREQLEDILGKRNMDVKSVERFINRMKPSMTSKDVEQLYDSEYNAVIANHPTAVMAGGKYKINIYSQHIYNYVISHVEPATAILDMGCNSGDLILGIASALSQGGGRNKGRYVGVDFNKEAIEEADRKLEVSGLTNCEFFCCDIVEWESKERFDYILLSDVIEHLCDRELSSILQKCRSLLKEGGMIIMHTPNGLNEYSQSDPTLCSRAFFWFYHKITGTEYYKTPNQIYYEQVHINIKSFRQWKRFFAAEGYDLRVKYDEEKANHFLEKWKGQLCLNNNMMLFAVRSVPFKGSRRNRNG